MRGTGRIAGLLGGVLFTAVAAAGCEPGPPTLTVDGSPLVDGGQAVVHGSGFVAGEELSLVQCAAQPIGIVDCDHDTSTTVTVAPDGSFDATVTVYSQLRGWGRRPDCRAGGSCVLAARVGYDGTAPIVVPLVFDPVAPLRPNPTLTADTTIDLVDGQRVRFTGRNFLRTSGTQLRGSAGPVEIFHCMPQEVLYCGRLPMAEVPVEDLHDFESMEVRGTGFAPAAPVEVRICRSDDVLQCDNRGRETPAADEDGALVTEISVWSSWESYTGESTDCRQPPGCVVVATPLGSDQDVTVPLSFGPLDPGRGRYLDPVFEEVDAVHDVVYRDTVDSQGRPIQLKMDIFRPRGDTETNRPAIVWMHGGFFVAGDKSNMHPDAIASAQRGYVGISLQYRLRPGATGWHDMYQASLDAYDDATVGVFWLKVHAAEYGINPDAIIAGGFSAGAVTALNLAYLPGERGPLEPLIAAAVPRGGILYTPPVAGDPPTIAFHGSVDEVTKFANLGDVCDLASAVDIPCELVVYDGDGHTEGDLDDVMRRTSDFLAEHVLGPMGYLDD